MELYLFRHGIADDAQPGGPDSARELTDEGRKKVADVVKLARKADVRPSLIVSSPYARARQTARIAAEELEYRGHVLPFESLVPHGSPEQVWQDVRDHADEAAVLLAGHEPLLGRLAAYLLNAPSLRVEMKKSALLRIDMEVVRPHPHGVLRWMIVPKMT